MTNPDAYLLRENTGTSGVVETARAAVAVLADHKLDSWVNSPLKRLRDKTDVVELILRRKLPRELAVHPAVVALYTATWDALQTEK